MTNTIKISEKDKMFQIATKSGWVMKMGMRKVTCLKNTENDRKSKILRRKTNDKLLQH
ncbi:hypothetical protein HXF18_14735 [Listeria monocytogenes]|uniref:hypothetical protein n=1 Tax=Listeria monocytogenes TaxID=1639 RepID=UPI0014250A85|nr:hypothetical protein [Listeria monocytogenes]EDN9152143.1 hypothetical protein [Listeria monocytogenes]EJE4568262.1 hypothetical protein [Listeria monocytogenes]EKE6119122.1 hypothetical protein [Listeria monocytogenes]EKZ4223560.1 hypothetical protein [Listeria monocytogenes]NVT28237.1 hypothetical protein [Listeria monocytogenes]